MPIHFNHRQNPNSNKCRCLYMYVDLWHNEEPLCVGTINDICEFTGKSKNAILSAISHAKARGTRSHYIKIGDLDDE